MRDQLPKLNSRQLDELTEQLCESTVPEVSRPRHGLSLDELTEKMNNCFYNGVCSRVVISVENSLVIFHDSNGERRDEYASQKTLKKLFSKLFCGDTDVLGCEYRYFVSSQNASDFSPGMKRDEEGRVEVTAKKYLRSAPGRGNLIQVWTFTPKEY